MSLFAERLKLLKDESGISQKDLADDLGISAPQLSYFTKGREPNFDKLIDIADYFDVTVDYLVGKSNQRNIEDKTVVDEIKTKTDTTTLTDANKEKIESYILLLYKTLSKLIINSDDGIKLQKVSNASIDSYLKGLSKYIDSAQGWNNPDYPLDDLRMALNDLIDSTEAIYSHASDLIVTLLSDNNVSPKTKNRINLSRSFSISPKPKSRKE